MLRYEGQKTAFYEISLKPHVDIKLPQMTKYKIWISYSLEIYLTLIDKNISKSHVKIFCLELILFTSNEDSSMVDTLQGKR